MMVQSCRTEYQSPNKIGHEDCQPEETIQLIVALEAKQIFASQAGNENAQRKNEAST